MMNRDSLNSQQVMMYSALGIALFLTVWYGAVALEVTPKHGIGMLLPSMSPEGYSHDY